MSNYNHTIETGAEEFLKVDPNNWGRHAGWNFNGIIRYEDGQFFEHVYQYHALSGTMQADTLRELMTVVNEEYGWH